MPVKYGTEDEPDYEVYLHRIGRAGRFGRKGKFASVVLVYNSMQDTIVFSMDE
jgi:superfamily II DNA/RNA helicase